MNRAVKQVITRSRWYLAALAKNAPPAQITEPKAGYFKRRFVRGGPWVPARIYVEEFRDPETNELTADQVFYCDVGDDSADPFNQWVSLLGHPITKAEYDQMMAKRDWAHNPQSALDPNTSPPAF